MSRRRDLQREEQLRVKAVYQDSASSYDRKALLLLLIGYRDAAYRRQAIDALRLRPGSTVVELGCGTGANHAAVMERLGPEGRLIAVDMTPAMLELARARAKDNGWENIEFVESEAGAFDFPTDSDAVFSTFVLAFVPECDAVVERACRALKPGGRWAVADQKVPSWGQSFFAPAFAAATRRFGVTREMLERRPWEEIGTAMRANLVDVCWKEHYFGFSYVAWGERSTQLREQGGDSSAPPGSSMTA